MATLRDCVYGLAGGDALGVPYEFCARGSFECSGMVGGGAHGKPAGTWSDDTSMALCICDSFKELGHIDEADIRERFGRWLFGGEYTVDGVFDVGGTTARALRAGRGMDGERDNGNGSLMRTVPLALMGATDDEVRAVSAVTHAHRTSAEACVAAVRVARRLADGEPPEKAAVAELPGFDPSKHRADVRSGGYVLDTLDAALWCLCGTATYRDCVLAAVNLGDDSDTTAAVAGAFAGIAYGAESIPAEWLSTLRGRDVIDSCLP